MGCLDGARQEVSNFCSLSLKVFNYCFHQKTNIFLFLRKNREDGGRNSSGNNIDDGSVLCADPSISINGLYTKPRMVVASCCCYRHGDVGSLHGAARQRLYTSRLLLSSLLVVS